LGKEQASMPSRAPTAGVTKFLRRRTGACTYCYCTLLSFVLLASSSNAVPTAHRRTCDDHSLLGRPRKGSCSGSRALPGAAERMEGACVRRGAFLMCRAVVERGDEVVKYSAFVVTGTELAAERRPVSWGEALQHWQRPGGSDFTELFLESLQEAQFGAFFWEAPRLTRATLDHRAFEFILRGSHRLASARPDARAFEDHLAPCVRRGTPAAVFENLGGDALLAAPCPVAAESSYTHLAAFVRHAPPQQVRGLWAQVGATAAARIRQQGERPVWLSTSGLGVYWLHVRMDERPKYYTYAPYAREPPQRTRGP